MTAWQTVLDTWGALGRPRRALVILAVTVPLLYAQLVWRGFEAGFVLCVGTLLLGPPAWRLLAPRGVVGAALFAVYGAAVVVLLAYVLPRVGRFEDAFLTAPSTLPIVFGLFVAGGVGLGHDVETERRLDAERARLDALARDKERAELLALRAQLDPHFLFNTLNAIAEWCAADPKVAERGILELAGVLRTVQSAVTAPSWPLADELALCSAVLSLHAIRDPGRFRGTVGTAGEAPTATATVPVPPMLLLPLVENAVKHGPAAGHVGPVDVRVTPSADGVRIDVTNPGPFTGRRPGGQGLDLVARRLALSYGDRASFEIRADGDRTRATLILPTEPT